MAVAVSPQKQVGVRTSPSNIFLYLAHEHAEGKKLIHKLKRNRQGHKLAAAPRTGLIGDTAASRSSGWRITPQADGR